MTYRGWLIWTASVLAACCFVVAAAHGVPSSWPRVLANVLVSEGGNVDDPDDPGGRTSRGIIQREWDAWRVSHASLPADVWDAPQDQIEAIYDGKYWHHRCVRGDALPAGVDYTVSDYGVNSGVDRSGKVLRRLLGQDAGHCDVTDGLVTLLKTKDPAKAIRAINAERRQFLNALIQQRPKLAVFHTGWMKRVDAVERISLRMAGQPMLGLFGEELDTTPAFGPGKAWVQ